MYVRVGCALVVLMIAQGMISPVGAVHCGEHGIASASNSTCECQEGYYGTECRAKLVNESPTLFCLDNENGIRYFCFTLYPLDCMHSMSVNLILFAEGEIPFLAKKSIVEEGETSAEICSESLTVSNDNCTPEKACVTLEDITLEKGTFTGTVAFQTFCGSDEVLSIALDFGILETSNSECGEEGTLYPAAEVDLQSGGITANGMEVDGNGCIIENSRILFCPIVLTDPCDDSVAVLISKGDIGFHIPLSDGQDTTDCHPLACVDVSDVAVEDGSVSFTLQYSKPTNATLSVTYQHVTATSRECGQYTDPNGQKRTIDLWPLMWEILAAGVMVMLCMGLVILAVVVVMYRKKHGDPSGYGVMDSDPDSLLDELGDEEAEETV